MFTLVRRVLLNSLPVDAPDQLVELGCVNANEADKVACQGSYPGFLMFRAENQVLAGLFAFAPLEDLSVALDGDAERRHVACRPLRAP